MNWLYCRINSGDMEDKLPGLLDRVIEKYIGNRKEIYSNIR